MIDIPASIWEHVTCPVLLLAVVILVSRMHARVMETIGKLTAQLERLNAQFERLSAEKPPEK